MHDARRNDSPFDIISFQPVYAFIDYRAATKQYEVGIRDLIACILLDKKRLATKSIYSLLRVYRIHESFSLALFVGYTILVHEHIAAGNGEEKPVFLSLHRSLVVQHLPFYFQKSLIREDLLCIEKLKANIPTFSDAVDGVVQSCLGNSRDGVVVPAYFVSLLYDSWKAEDFGVVANLFSKFSLRNEQILGLLRTASAWKFQINTKVIILSELVKCNVLNAAGREYISKNLSNSDPDLIIVYSLALVSYICREKKAGKIVDDGIMKLYLRLYIGYPSVFVYSDGTHSAEYYMLHAYDILFNHQCYSRDKDFQMVWKEHLLPNYRLNFFTGLWGSLTGILDSPSPAETDYDELVEMKRWTFRMIRFYFERNQDQGAFDRVIYNLFKSGMASPDIYVYYFQSDPKYSNYLIARCFLYCSELRGKRLNYPIDHNYTENHRSKVIAYLRKRATSLTRMANFCISSRTKMVLSSQSSVTKLKISIFWLCKTVYQWRIIDCMGGDEELQKLVENMMACLSNALLRIVCNENSTVSRELQVMQALNSIYIRGEGTSSKA